MLRSELEACEENARRDRGEVATAMSEKAAMFAELEINRIEVPRPTRADRQGTDRPGSSASG